MSYPRRPWDEVMDEVRDGLYGEWHAVRRRAEEEIVGRLREAGYAEGEHGISSSDINHTIYGMVCAGDLTPIVTIERVG